MPENKTVVPNLVFVNFSTKSTTYKATLLNSLTFTELKSYQPKSVIYVYFWFSETSVLRITWLVSSLRHPPHRVRGPGLAQKSFLSLWSIALTFSVTYSKPGRAHTRLKQWQGESKFTLLSHCQTLKPFILFILIDKLPKTHTIKNLR